MSSIYNTKTKIMRGLAIAGVALTTTLLTGPLTSAQAYNARLGDFDIQIDTTVSVGMSWLTKSVREQYLPISNGGPADGSGYGAASVATATIAADKRAGVYGALDPSGNFVNSDDEEAYGAVLGGAALGVGCVVNYGAYCQEIIARPNFDGSINTDDGRLNFDQGDPYSGFIRVTPEIEARSGNITAFARVNIWHDVVAMDDGAYNRGGDLSGSGEDNVGQDIELLDAYIAYEGDVGDMPFTVKLGRQVINWGEATFIPGGNSSFNPIDVAALRRPGAEIKEALLPVEAIYGSLAVTQDLTVETYIGGWDKYRLDGGGTPNSISDSFTEGTTTGNPRDIYFIGGGGRAGDQFACTGAADLAALGTPQGATSAALINAIMAIDGAVNCDESPNLDVLSTWTVGNAEAERWAAGDTNYITGLSDKDGQNAFGIALRYYAANLNSTEFGLYYQKGDSRLPYVSFRTGQVDVKASSTSAQASTVGRGVGAIGCALIADSDGNPDTGFDFASAMYAAGLENVSVNNSKDLLHDAAIQGTASIVATAAGYTRVAPVGDNAAYLTETNCLLTLGQADNTVTLGSAFDGAGQLHTGATNIGVAPEIALFAEFPEVETYGASFNTTLFGWGVQGDFTYRPDVPLQIDTDVLTIASLFNNCAFTGTGAYEPVYLSGSTFNNEFGGIGCSDQNQYLRGYTTDHDAFTWDIGTTATFTRSNPIVAALGSDLGIFLTEFQGVSVSDIENLRGDTGGLIDPSTGAHDAGIAPLSNVCVGGSDLPLNGILSIDDRVVGAADDDADQTPKGYCRPTDSSWGVVIFAQLQYNNVFGTPIGLKPTLVYSHGVEGFSPSPIGFWREDQGSTAIRLDGEYLGRWSGSLAYRTYHGDTHRTKNLDRDTVSISVTYAY